MSKGAFLNFRDGNGGTAIFYASDGGYTEIVKILLYAGADPNIKMYNGINPLINMANLGDFEMAQLLLYNQRTALNVFDNNFATPLHHAAIMGHFYIVDMLLYYGADANLLATKQSSPLLMAAIGQHTETAELLIKAGNSVSYENGDSQSPINVAINLNDSAMIDLFIPHLQKDSLDENQKISLLYYAIQCKNKYALERLTQELFNGKIPPDSTSQLREKALKLQYVPTIKYLDKQHIKIGYKPILSGLKINFSTALNANDKIFFMGMGIHEARYNASFVINYGTRFSAKAILEEEGPNTLYQLWEKRRIIELQTKKYFLLPSKQSFQMKPFVGLNLQYHFGPLRGFSRKIETGFVLAPELGVSIDMQWLALNIAYQYSPYKLYEISVHRVNFGLVFTIPLYTKPQQYKLSWMP
jgi:hypothetical protein